MPDPKISVVVPCHGRQASLDVLVASLADQALGAEHFEVILVDDGSPLPLRTPPATAGRKLRLIRHPRPLGPAAARNTGWRQGRGELVVFVDDDCRADPDWLRELDRAARRRPGAILQGTTLPDPRDGAAGPFSLTMHIEGPTGLFETCNIAYPRELLEQLDGFDEAYRRPCGEDLDLGCRATKAGAELEFVGSARVYHEVTEPTLGQHLRKTSRWTEAVRVLAAHPELRSFLVGGLLWKRSHAYPVVSVPAGLLALAHRRPWVAIAAQAPWVADAARRRRGDRRFSRPAGIARYLVIDLWEIVTMVRGSLEHRTPML